MNGFSEHELNHERLVLKTNLYLVRHGQSTSNISGGLQTDPELTEAGVLQARNAGIMLRERLGTLNPAAIIHTGLKRTLDTAIEIKRSGGFSSDLMEMPAFREREMGIYEKLSLDELLSRNPQMQGFYKKYGPSCVWFFDGVGSDGVEPLHPMKQRVKNGLRELSQKFGDEPTILVGHSGSIKMARMMYERVKGDMRNYLSSYVPVNCEIYGMGIKV